jgi:hypothetical protein
MVGLFQRYCREEHVFGKATRRRGDGEKVIMTLYREGDDQMAMDDRTETSTKIPVATAPSRPRPRP